MTSSVPSQSDQSVHEGPGTALALPKGFTAAGISAGLKGSGAPDLALVVNRGPQATAAGVFTTNRIVGAPVLWSRQVIARGQARAVLLNSGGANVCTGEQGYQDVLDATQRLAPQLGIEAGEVLVASTGLIGERLPMDRVRAGIDEIAGRTTERGLLEAATAIMTTDTVPKLVSRSGAGYGIAGIAKGAGMLAPALATMLSVIVTDAVLTYSQAQEILHRATSVSFDRIDSDGAMSTSDMVLLLASGASGEAPEIEEFESILTQVCADLARALIADAEGASHDIAITVNGATDETAGLAVARAVSRSNLVKTAIFGNDPNWGRILAQIGTVPEPVAPYDPDQVDVAVNGVLVCMGGQAHLDRSLVDLSADREVHIDIDLNAGESSVTIWTNDLTHHYVHENSAYST